MLWLPFQYIYWHYGRALQAYVRLLRDVLWYVAHVFSIGLLTRTLLQPWKRRNEVYQGGGIEQYFEAIVVSALSRVVGVVIRLPIIIVGIAVWVVTALVLLVGFGLWLAAPLVLAGMIMSGSYLLYVSI